MADVMTVNLSDRSYPILLGSDLAAEVRSKIAKLAAAGRKIAVLTDQHLVDCQGAALRAMFGDAPTLVVPPGEETKSLASLGRVLDFLAAQHLERTSALFTVGGGVIGDLGGFAAAAYLRGIDYFQVPTTLLAMVDSSVGGKTGINLKAGKNLVGAFHQPRGVFIATGCWAPCRSASSRPAWPRSSNTVCSATPPFSPSSKALRSRSPARSWPP
jgi:3-dehydroquinate synthase